MATFMGARRKAERTFVGKTYRFCSFETTKADADKMADHRRERGSKARVIKTKDGFSVWAWGK